MSPETLSKLLSDNGMLKVVKCTSNFLSFPGCYSLSDLKWGDNGETYKDLNIFPMDIASSFAINALDISKHSQNETIVKVLDLCCSPGAKFQMISEYLNSKSVLIGVDISAPRLEVCKALITKTFQNQLTNNTSNDILEISNFPRQLIFCCDGTTFCPDNFGTLVIDSQIINNELKHCGKRKRVNKSAKQRERKLLKLTEQSLRCDINSINFRV
jgi:SAM-dependent methyltransferase